MQQWHHYFSNMFTVCCCSTCTLNLSTHLLLYSSPIYHPLCALVLLFIDFFSSALFPSSISQPSAISHGGQVQHCALFHGIRITCVLNLHRGHFWAFLCPCSMTLAQFRSSLSPFLYSRHLTPLCHGAWHLKHHTNWQLLHRIYRRNRIKCIKACVTF